MRVARVVRGKRVRRMNWRRLVRVMAVGFLGAKLANPAERFDLAASDVLKGEVQLEQRGVAFDGVEVRGGGLDVHERFAQRLLAGGEIGEKGIPPAGALRVIVRAAIAVPAAVRVMEGAENFVEGPIQQMHERVRVRERGLGALNVQQVVPPCPDLGALGSKGVHQSVLHRAYSGKSPRVLLRAACRNVRKG